MLPESLISAGIASIFSGGGLWIGLKLFTEWRISRTQRQDESAAQAHARDAEREETAFSRMERAMERMDKDIARTSARAEQAEARLATSEERLTASEQRIDSLEEANDALAEENRTFRHVVIGVMNRLRRKPPDSPESILAYILEHLPFLGKDHA